MSEVNSTCWLGGMRVSNGSYTQKFVDVVFISLFNHEWMQRLDWYYRSLLPDPKVVRNHMHGYILHCSVASSYVVM